MEEELLIRVSAEDRYDIDVDDLVKANTKLVDENRYIRRDLSLSQAKIIRAKKVISIGLGKESVNERVLLKAVKRVLEGKRSFLVEKLLEGKKTPVNGVFDTDNEEFDEMDEFEL